MKLASVVSALITVVAAVIAVIAFTTEPGTVSASDGTRLIAAAESSYELNSENTENVYQQQVVALWSIRDLDTIQAEQNATIINSQVAVLDRQAKILAWAQAAVVLLVLFIGLASMWAVVIGRQLLVRRNGIPTPVESESP